VSALFLIMRTLASGTRMFVPSLVMVLAWKLYIEGHGQTVTYRVVPDLKPYVIAIMLLTILTCIYTALGGIKAVIWTDVVQATLMFGGALVAIGILLYHVGGFHGVAQAVPEMTRLEGYFKHGFEASAIAGFKAEHHIAAMG